MAAAHSRNGTKLYAEGKAPVSFRSVVSTKRFLSTAVKKRWIESDYRYRRADEYAKRVTSDSRVNVKQVDVQAHGFDKGCLTVSTKKATAQVNIPTGTIFHTGTTMQNLAVVEGFKGEVRRGEPLILDAFCMDPAFACAHGRSVPMGLKVKGTEMNKHSQGSFWTWMHPCNDVVELFKNKKGVVTARKPVKLKVPGVSKSQTCQTLFDRGVFNDRAADDSDSSDSDSDSDSDMPRSRRRRQKKKLRKMRKGMLKGRYKSKGKLAKKYGGGGKLHYVCPRDGRGAPLHSRKNSL